MSLPPIVAALPFPSVAVTVFSSVCCRAVLLRLYYAPVPRSPAAFVLCSSPSLAASFRRVYLMFCSVLSRYICVMFCFRPASNYPKQKEGTSLRGLDVIEGSSNDGASSMSQSDAGTRSRMYGERGRPASSRASETVNDIVTTSKPALGGERTAPAGLDRNSVPRGPDSPHRFLASSILFCSVSRSEGSSVKSVALPASLSGWARSGSCSGVPSPRLSHRYRGISDHAVRRVMGAFARLPASPSILDRRASCDKGEGRRRGEVRVRRCTGKL